MPRKLHAEEIVTALLESEKMKETAAYLNGGRRFSALSSEELPGRWVSAFKQWFADRAQDSQRTMNDLEAELRLRGAEPPMQLVQSEMEAARAEIRADDPRNPGVRAAIRAFLDSLDSPDA